MEGENKNFILNWTKILELAHRCFFDYDIFGLCIWLFGKIFSFKNSHDELFLSFQLIKVFFFSYIKSNDWACFLIMHASPPPSPPLP